MLTASYVLLTLGGRARPGAHRHDLRGDQPRSPRRCSSPRSALIYTATGTVNMADLSVKIGALPTGLRAPSPCCCWWCSASRRRCSRCSSGCPTAIPTAPSPVTAVFAGLLTKVGVYAIDPHPDAAVPARRRPATLILVARRAHDGGRRARRHRPGRRQAHPVVQHRQPHRLHGDGSRPLHRRRVWPPRSSTPCTTSWRRRRCS